LTSKISSSSSATAKSGALSCEGAFAIGTVADAPPVIAKDAPAAANTGRATFLRFRFDVRFERAM
jgi:hypothetical protein